MEAFLTDIPAMDQSIHLSKEPKKQSVQNKGFYTAKTHSGHGVLPVGRL
jgi:hypothetical protein